MACDKRAKKVKKFKKTGLNFLHLKGDYAKIYKQKFAPDTLSDYRVSKKNFSVEMASEITKRRGGRTEVKLWQLSQ